MSFTRVKNGVRLLNKESASGRSLSGAATKFNGVNFDYSEMTIDTTLGTPDTTVYFNIQQNTSTYYDIAWGDGSVDSYYGSSGGGTNHSYTYAANGTYTIRWINGLNSTATRFRSQSGQQGLFTTKLTDITHWGWSLGLIPNWFNTGILGNSVNITRPSASDKAPEGANIAMSATGVCVDRNIREWGTKYKSVRLGTGTFYNNQNYNEVWTGVTPDFSGTGSGNVFNRCGNFNQNVDSWAPETRQCLNWANFFLRAFAFNNGDPVGVSGGSVGTGWDTFNVSATYASGTTTGVTTNKLVDSTATFITDEVAVGMKVHLRYEGVFTTVSSVDSETELTLADDLFTTIGDKYSITRSNIPTIALMMAQIQSFNQVIDSWDTSGQTNFRNCVGGGLNQDLRTWDISQSTNCQQFPTGAFNFGFPSGVANTYAQAWNGQTAQVQTWQQSFGAAFNSDISGWDFGYPNNMPSGTNTTQTTNKLIDSGATFQTAGVTTSGWRVTNMDTGKQATVSSVDSETELTLSADIFTGTGENYEVFYGVRLSQGYWGSITYPINTLDMRCVWNMEQMFGNGTTAITADLGDWNVRNSTSFGNWFSASGGDKSSMVFNIRNWERGAIGDADYSTTRCNTSLRNFMYHAEPANNLPMDNWDTRNVTTWSAFNQNGRWYNSTAEWCMASANTVTNAFYSNPIRLKALAMQSWYAHPNGCNIGTNASNSFPGTTEVNAIEKIKTPVTVSTGTTTGTGTDNDVVIDSSATFITDGVSVADTVNNTTTGQHAYVMSVDSETQLTVSMTYFGSIGDSYTVVTGYDGQESYKGFLKLTAPTPNANRTSGTTTGTTAFKLVDSGATFVGTVNEGDIITNSTDGTYSYVETVDSNTELTLWDDIFVSGESYSVDGGFGWTITSMEYVTVKGRTTNSSPNKLIDSGATFTSTVVVGMRVRNSNVNPRTFATVTAIDSDTQLSLDTDIMSSVQYYQIDWQF